MLLIAIMLIFMIVVIVSESWSFILSICRGLKFVFWGGVRGRGWGLGFVWVSLAFVRFVGVGVVVGDRVIGEVMC